MRMLSWMIPSAQKRMLTSYLSDYTCSIVIELGDPVDDLSVATVLMVVGGQLILLRPRKVCLLFDEFFMTKLTATSQQIRRSTTTCRYLQTELSFAGFTSVA